MNLPLLFVFYDASNLNSMIYSGSYVQLGLNPYGPGGTTVAGYLLQPYYYFSFIIYRSSAFDPLQVALVLKILAIPATYFAGVSLYRISKRLRPGSERVMLYSLLFNPVLIFVNSVWVESDVFVILFLLVALDLLWAKPDPPGGARRTFYGAAALIWAGFSYYSPVALIPSFLVNQRGRAAFLRLTVCIAVLAIVFAIPILLSGLVSTAPTNFVHGNSISSISILNLILPASVDHWAIVPGTLQTLALIAVGITSIGVPLVFVRWGLPLPLGQLVVFAVATTLAFTFVEGDNVVLFLPFLYLTLLCIPRFRVTYRNLVLVQLFVVPEFIVVMMTNGPGYVSGIYYWAYYLLHQNFFLGQTLGDGVWKASLLVYYAGMVGTLAVLVRGAWHARTRAPSEAVASQERWEPPAQRSRSSFATTGLAVCVAVLMLVPVGAGIAEVSSGRVTVTNGFPAYLFGVEDPSQPHTTTLLPAPSTYTVSPGNRAVQFPENGSEVTFLRPLSSITTSIDFVASLPYPAELAAGKMLTFMEAEQFYSSFANVENLSGSGSWVVPNSTANVTGLTLDTTVLEGPAQAYQIPAGASLGYASPLVSIANRTWSWAEFMTANGTAPTVLWWCTVSDWTLVAAESDHHFYVTGTSSSGASFNVSAAADFDASSWVLTGFTVDSVGRLSSILLNGARLNVPATLSGSLDLRVGGAPGVPPTAERPLAPALASAAYAVPGSGLRFKVDVLAALSNLSSPVAYLPGTSTAATFRLIDGEQTVTLGTTRWTSTIPPSANNSKFVMGRIGDRVAALDLTFSLLGFEGKPGWDNLGVVILLFGAGLPGAIVTSYFVPVRGRMSWRRPNP